MKDSIGPPRCIDDPFSVFLNIYRTVKSYKELLVSAAVDDNGCLVSFVVDGFSKSGQVDVKLEDGIINVYQRYGKVDQIESFDELSDIAWVWYLNYSDQGYSIPQCWIPYWSEQKMIKLVTPKPHYAIVK